jgi:hypothetical protein
MDFKNIIVGLLILAGIITSFVSIMVVTDSDLDTKWSENITSIGEITNITNTMSENVRHGELEDKSFIMTAITGVWSSILLIFSSFDLYVEIINVLADNTFMAGDLWVQIAISFLVISVVSMIIYAVVRWKLQT